MPLNSSTLSAELRLDLNAKTGKVVDKYDYAGDSISYSDVVGLGSVVGPTSTLVDKPTTVDPLVDITAPNSESAAFSLPVDSAGAVLKGAYQLNYKVIQTKNYTGQSITVANQITLNGEHQDEITAGESITITGSGAGNNGTYTIVSATNNSGNTDVIISEGGLSLEGGGFAAGITNTYEKTWDFCYEDDVPTLSIQMGHDCDGGSLYSKDITAFTGNDVINTRAHTLQSPRNSAGNAVTPDITSSVVASNGQLNAAQLWTKTWVAQIATTATRTQADGLILDYSLSGTEEETVSCDGDQLLTNAYNCLSRLKSAYSDDCGCFGESDLSCAVNEATAEFMLYEIRRKTDTDTAMAHAQAVIDIANKYGCDCTSSISTSSGEPELVQGGSVFIGTLGQMYYADGQGKLVAIGVGTDGQIIVYQSGLPVIQDPADWATFTGEGQLVKSNSSNEPTVFGPGDANDVLITEAGSPNQPVLKKLGTCVKLSPDVVTQASFVSLPIPANFFQETDDALIVEGFTDNMDASATIAITFGAGTYSQINVNSFDGFFKFIIRRDSNGDLEVAGMATSGGATNKGTVDTFTPANILAAMNMRCLINNGNGELIGVDTRKSRNLA